MNTKRTIRKILFAAMWLAIGGGMLTLLIAAMGRQKKDVCKGFDIIIKAERSEDFFLDEGDISALLKKTTRGNIKGQPKTALNLQQMERLLEKNVWIRDAQLYFDNQGTLHVSVAEREPVARIFTAGGNSFYIDDQQYKLPLSDKAIARVPVFTGLPDKKKWTAPDSALVKDIIITAQFINNHSFWQSQVVQIDVAACGSGCWEFEMVPLVGNNIIKLGTGENIDKKFNRLFTFYKQVLATEGFDKYKVIDVRFNEQVIGVKGS